MKKQVSPKDVALPEHLHDLIDLSEISGPFRDFVKNYLFHPHCIFPHYQFSEERLLLALNEAKSCVGTCEGESLTLQVLKFIEKIELRLDHSYVHPAIKRIGEFYWQDRALEFFEFLVSRGGYPIERWHYILWNHENFCDWPSFDSPGAQPKQIEDHLVEGLLRHSHENPPVTSPFSLYFWFNIELWRTEPRMPGGPVIETKNKETGEREPDEGEAINTLPWESAQYPHSKKTFNAVLRRWVAAMLEANNEDAVYAFLDWIEIHQEIHHIKDQLEESQSESIWNELQQRPVPQVRYPLALKDIPFSIRALDRKLWLDGDKVFSPSECLRKNLQQQLAQIAQLCANDQLKAKIPLGSIRDLVRVFKWAPDGYILISDPDPAQDALAIKLFALMRSCLQHEPESFQIYDYLYSMRYLVGRRKKEAAVLRQLLMALRTSPRPCSNEALNFRPKRQIIRYIRPVNFDGLPPEYCLSCLIDLLIGSWQIKDRRRELCIETADYFSSRLKFHKTKGRTRSQTAFEGFYKESQCVESSSIWRRAYAEALGELGYALDGKVLHLLDFVRKHDPEESVREAAHSSYRLIHREQTKELDDYKSLRAAFWALRKAQREELQLPVELAQAKLLRGQEMRNERQTDASRIYIGYLDTH